MVMKPDWAPPPCPKCDSDAMGHYFFNIGDKRNGWYCEICGAGAYQLGTMEEAKQSVNTEAQMARAIGLLNRREPQ